MKTIILENLKSIALTNTPKPQIQSDKDVLLRIASVGVCGSDVHYYRTGRIGDQIIKYPFRIGHECSAIVEQVGADVSRVKPGDRVAVEPAVSCWKCDQCKAGRPHTCRSLKFLGCPGQLDGCLAEYLIMPETCCFPIPDTMTLTEAALVEPLSIGVYASSFLDDQSVQDVAILGSGPIGLSVMQALRAQNHSKISMTDKLDYRLDIAAQNGASWTGNPDKIYVETEMDPYGDGIFDAIFECCGEQEAIDQAVRLVRPGGRIIIVGIPEVERISFDIHTLRRKEIAVYNVRRQNDCVQKAIDWVGEKRVQVDFMATHNFSIEQAPEAFELVEGYNDSVVKAMIHIAE